MARTLLLEQVDVQRASNLISELVDFVTCFQCCKYFVSPETAACGHTLCHLCWGTCRSCPSCDKNLDKKGILLNMEMKNSTTHVKDLVKSFEKIFGVKMDEFRCLGENEENRNVKEWLSSSQNHFSAPPYSETPTSIQDILPLVEVSSSEIQVHTKTNKNKSPPKVAHVPPPQDDWDIIETVPNTEEIIQKNNENIVGPMDLEPFLIDDNEYTNVNPRRSSRKREIKETVKKLPKKADVSVDKHSSNNSSLDNTDKRLDKAKQNWTNVKKMRKEFSKLNKENKNKLNVSIEMCKKTKSTVSKASSVTQQPWLSPAKVYTIEEDTPEVTDEVITRNALSFPKNNLNVNAIEKNIDITPEAELPDLIKNKETHLVKSSKTMSAKKQDKITSNEISENSNKKEINQIKPDETLNLTSDPHANDASNKKIPFLKKSTFHNNSNDGNHTVTIDHKNLPDTSNTNEDDIHITIKIGSVVTNITINKKCKDVKLNVNTDREVQASLGPNGITHTNIVETVNKKDVQLTDAQTGTDGDEELTFVHPKKDVATVINNKSGSTKKHTASAETATVQYEITESVEKELSNIMECEENDEPAPNKSVETKSDKQPENVHKSGETVTKPNTVATENNNNQHSQEPNDDLDIFNSGSVKEITVQPLDNVHGAPSEIFVSTHRSKGRTQKLSDKRNRDVDDEKQIAKRPKLDSQKTDKSGKSEKYIDPSKMLEMSSENTNYDAIMSQVFANIDADMNENSKTQTISKHPAVTQDKVVKPSQVISSGKMEINTNTEAVKADTEIIEVPVVKNIDQKYSENMFSTIGNVDAQLAGPETQKHIDNILTPGMCRNLGENRDQSIAVIESAAGDVIQSAAGDVIEDAVDDVMENMATPAMDYDSDKSVVEDTPQKNNSKQIIKPNSSNRTESKKLTLKTKRKSIETQDVINITDTMRDSADCNEVTILDNKRSVSETPLTMNRFVGQLKHKSTPVARKSLDFRKNETEDDDVTLCPSVNEIAKTTQEKELMSEAFAATPTRKPLQAKNAIQSNMKFVIAGSCLSSTESTNLKILCFKRKWLFVDKYSPDLTHLVVGVDDENRSQRSVKYMCALAAGKWIVGYKWVERCLETNTVVNEEPYEALDSTGDPGPTRSRLATKKVFEGITFFCMPPFTLLDVDTLKDMLQAAGGRVAARASGVGVRGAAPALLLAEPQHTQEDKYVYLAVELNLVPVNYEWALNCLGSYSLCSLLELLLCPAALLPPATAAWPAELLANEE